MARFEMKAEKVEEVRMAVAQDIVIELTISEPPDVTRF